MQIAKENLKSLKSGDWVYLKLQLYHLSSIFKIINQKHDSKYFGPFQASKQIGYVVCCLELHVESKIHPIFHVLLLFCKIWEVESDHPTLTSYSSDGLPAL